MVNFSLILFIYVAIAFASDDEYRLIQDLKKNYDPFERPVYNHSKSIVVNLRILLQQLVDVTWNDYKLKWDPMEYGGIKDIRFPSASDVIWKPDVLLFSSADDKFDASFPVNLIVSHTGDILVAPPGIIKSSCKIDITWFPFDEQICILRYGSWTYTGNKLDLHIDDPGIDSHNQMDLSYYVQNGEWDLISAPAHRVVTEFNDEKYIELHYKLHLRRKRMFYGLNWIIPSVLISLSNVLGFSLPPESGEKITLQITNLLSVTVFLGMVYEVTPPTSESVPIIAAFFSASMLILGCSVMTTVLIINLHFRTSQTHQMSSWMKKVFLGWMPWLLLMNRPGHRFSRNQILERSFISKHSIPQTMRDFGPVLTKNTKRLVRGGSMNSLRCICDGRDTTSTNPLLRGSDSKDNHTQLINVALCEDTKLNIVTKPEIPWENSKKKGIESEICNLENTLREISEFLKILRTRMKEEDEEEDGHNDWRFVAMVVDRLCLFLFSIAIVFASMFILFNRPGIYVTLARIFYGN